MRSKRVAASLGSRRTPEDQVMNEAKKEYSLLSRFRNCAEEHASKKEQLKRATQALDIAFSNAESNLNAPVPGVGTFATEDLVCVEVEIEWPDDTTYYRAFVCDVRDGVHLLCYVDDESGDVTTEEIDLRTTDRKWRFAVPRQYEDHLVGRRVIIDPDAKDDTQRAFEKTVFVLARREADDITCPECKKTKTSRVKPEPCAVHHTIIFIEDSWVTYFNFANNDFNIQSSSHK